MKSSEIRQAFVDFFVKQKHQWVPPAALIPTNDPTLLFTNAGMVQFKDVFLGLDRRSYQRAVTTQPCVRAGGKHNDLENVGYTARHHTFFEMLGNFSFGDYFKREAIQFAWEFLTQVMHLPEEKLWVTVYKDDQETADIWLKDMKVSSDRFSYCGEKDNFWSMGDTGPCGPCTEIFYDHGPEISGGPPGSPEEDGDRYIEIWNLVFMQFNRDKDGVLHPLPKPSVDTGMGLERLAAVVQGVHSNYGIDSFQYLIKAIAAKGQGIDIAHNSLKVIADHIRSTAFLIADGVTPGNEGRGYVLRRIIRRAVRHGNTLGLPTGFFSELINPVIAVMGDAYAQLKAQRQHIEKTVLQEENQFAHTLSLGLALLHEQMQSLGGKEINGQLAFKLYDTYGFPVDLTADIAREKGLHIDMDGFNRCMQQQREQSQAASAFHMDYTIAPLHQQSTFHGYEKEAVVGKITGLLQAGKEVSTLAAGSQGAVVLDNTPFYAESGGQVGDRGILQGDKIRFRVDDTQKHGQAIIHYGELLEGALHPGLPLEACVDSVRRDAIRLNHTATHLVHAALREILGSQVQQKGSLVDADRARFDFSYQEVVSAPQIQAVEGLVNALIRENLAVETHIMDKESAQQSGALALFGEKYADSVRVLAIGDFSKELCGGTHARRTGDLGLFKIIAEYGVASGVRRIELLTGKAALAWVQAQTALLESMADLLKTKVPAVKDKLTQVLLENKQLAKEITALQSEKAKQSGASLIDQVEQIKGIKVLIQQVHGMDNQTMRSTLDQLKPRLDPAMIVLYAIQGEKLQVVASVSKNILDKAPKAVTLVQLLCGKGGGRDDMAQGGSVVPQDLQERVRKIKAML